MIDAFLSAASRPWLMSEDALRNLLAIAERTGDLEALQSRVGDRLQGTRRVSVRDNGVAVVPVIGPIFRYANLFTEISGATSTQLLALDLQQASDNPNVSSILLEVNSPGGDADGIAELAAAIYGARTRKPIKAYVGGRGASAAYWLASATDEIVVDRTALLGSIGVVMAAKDSRVRDERAGDRRIEIVSSQSPKKRIDPFTDAGAAEIQTIVDQLANIFIVDVASNRNVAIDDVMTKFGAGGVLLGVAAVAVGMADRLGSMEGLLAEMGANGGRTSSATAGRRSEVDQATAMLTASFESRNPLLPPSAAERAQQQDKLPAGGHAADGDEALALLRQSFKAQQR